MSISLRRKTARVIFGIVCAILFFLVLMIFLPAKPGSAERMTFEAAKGEGTREISYALEQQGLIRSAPVFRAYTLTLGISHRLQAGTYILGPGMSANEIAFKIAKGDVAKEYFTILEGWNIEDIKEYFVKKGRVMDISADLEGYLFPDTYHVRYFASNEEIISMMRSNFDKKFSDAFRRQALKQGKTINEIVVMASLLERELQTFQDKKIASGLLWKRLEHGIALQVDAAPDTYKERGLPAVPIANPGLESIEAALYPQESPYWYYLSTKEGETIFSKTLEEHNIAKAKYLK
ncbi:MAG: endolytic transglycosylase MltG [Candidatus Wildermuthbacteria bacterium]|nr:endolytic transglycosylase MltG [Candidatus Wildermuthbacteria bacterium]